MFFYWNVVDEQKGSPQSSSYSFQRYFALNNIRLFAEEGTYCENEKWHAISQWSQKRPRKQEKDTDLGNTFLCKLLYVSVLYQK